MTLVRSCSCLFLSMLLVSACRAEDAEQQALPEGAEPLIQEGITDDKGITRFSDATTGEEVRVLVLDENGVALSGADVVYQHGGGKNPYEAYFVWDDGSLSAAEFFPHNSEQTIQLTPGTISAVNPDQREAVIGYINDMALVSKSTYIETIPDTEKDRRMKNLGTYIDVLIFFMEKLTGDSRITKFVGEFSDFIFEAAELQGDPGGQWDLYEDYDATHGFTRFVFVQSQAPVVQTPRFETGEDGTVKLYLQALDPFRYSEESSQKPGLADHTIFEGATDFSDLIYHYEVEGPSGTVARGDVIQDAVCVQGDCKWTEIALGALPAGEYIVYHSATDEVGNKSEKGGFAFDLHGENAVEVEGFEGQTVGQRPSGWLGFGVDFFGNYVPLEGPNEFFVDDTESLTGDKSMRVSFVEVATNIAVFKPLGKTFSPPVEIIWNEKHDPVGTGSQGPSQGTQHALVLVTGDDCGFTAADTCQAVRLSISPHPHDERFAVLTTLNGQFETRLPIKTLPFTGGYDWTEFRIVWGTDNLVDVYIDGLLIIGNVPIDPGLTFDTIRWDTSSCCHTGDFWFDDIQIND